MREKPLQLAVAGLSHSHVRWLLRDWRRADLNVCGFWEPDPRLSSRYAKEFGIPDELIFADLGEMLAAAQPEAVAAFGPVFDHLRVVEACAPREVHVMVEKPLAVNGEHAERMAALARKHRIHLITNYETTWYATTYAAKRLAVEEAALGPVRKIVAHDGHHGPAEIGVSDDFLAWLTDPVLNGGGAVVDFGCYGANLITWLMDGAEPETVTAVLQTLKPDVYPRVDDEATIILTYPGAQGIIQGSWNWPVSRKDMEVYGRDGYLIAAGRQTLRRRMRGEDAETVEQLPPAPAVVADPFKYLAAVVRGEETVIPGNLWSLENNLTVVRILDAARQSAREERTVRLA